MNRLPIVEFHILQSFPVSCLNRDDVGSPKSALIGGTSRARVSSQCWKRALRLKMHELGTPIGLRTKNLASVLTAKSLPLCPDEAKAAKATEALASQLIAKDALIFVTPEEIDDLVTILKEADFSDSVSKDAVKGFVKKHAKGNFSNALDIALFGRMVAMQADLGVTAACSVAHAITTHKMESELDFYTAVADDDSSGEPGAAFLGVSEYSGGTFYRYICLDLNQLAANLCINELTEENLQDLEHAISDFTTALFVAVPSARQHTHAAFCPWNYARILVRNGQGIQVAFDKAVKSRNGFLEPSIEALKGALSQHEKLFGERLYGKTADIEFSETGDLSIDNVISKINGALHE
ncbi:MAG TPA: type I-E CRISPR-associated protein Cas7/Cse4/CasC [Candidatus Avisuccinivibrio pullicola]|nr:type I-E CRISPR-associated protein Cas7/Cse4/CasC [Candidatus Avisuccinivibrio pullicola]